MVAVPAATAVTSPLASTVAISPSLLLHVIFLSVAVSGVIVAVNCSVFPSIKFKADSFREIPVTSVTLTVNSTVSSPSARVVPSPESGGVVAGVMVALIIAAPTACAVTSPEEGSTVATVVLLLSQATVAPGVRLSTESVVLSFTFNITGLLGSVAAAGMTTNDNNIARVSASAPARRKKFCFIIGSP